MSARELLDGTLAYPIRGKPPVTPFGYEAVPGHPFLFTPTIDPCEHRTTRTTGCGKLPKTICTFELDGREIGLTTPIICKACDSNPEVYFMEEEDYVLSDDLQ